MKTDEIKIKRLETTEELESLAKGDVIIISVGSGKINDSDEYRGLALFTGQRFKGMQDEGFDFCRPQANAGDCFVGYHINRKDITITHEGVISSRSFSTYGTKYPSLTDLI
ncbi:hypothetical protein HY449_03095 [Candidatus Pacearchaeota archaeon]|nr:hypothetical protein [Candidatus Pacearchaeota archaeon]